MNWAETISCELIVLSLVHCLWQTTFIALGIAIAIRFARTASVCAACSALGLIVAAALVPVNLFVVAQQQSVRSTPSSGQTAQSAVASPPAAEQASSKPQLLAQRDVELLPAAEAELELKPTSALPSTTDARTGVLNSPGNEGSQTLPNLETVRADGIELAKYVISDWVMSTIAACYLLGVVLFALRMVLGFRFIVQLRKVAVNDRTKELSAIAAACATKLGTKLRPLVSLCDRVASPVVIGVIRPIVLVPPAILPFLSSEQLKAVLMHEIAHIARRDALLNVAQRMAETLLFFHPLVWWMSNRLSFYREMACDDLVTGAGISPLSYAESLLRVAETKNKAQGFALLAMSGGNRNALKTRISRLLAQAENAPSLERIDSAPTRTSTSGIALSAGLGILQPLIGSALAAAVLAVLVSISPVGVAAVADDDQEVSAEELEKLKEPIRLLTCLEQNELTLISFPHTESAGQTPEVRSIGHIESRWGFQIVGIHRGHLICKTSAGVHVVDLHSGDQRVLVQGAVSAAVQSDKELYYIAMQTRGEQARPDFRLMHLDLDSLETSELCRLENGATSSLSSGWRTDFSMAVSPDSNRVAVTESRREELLLNGNNKSRVVIAGPSTPARHSDFHFSNTVVMTGGGDYGTAPRLAWANSETLVVIDRDAPSGQSWIMMSSEQAALKLKALDIETLSVHEVCPLPNTPYSSRSPRFVHSYLGKPVIELDRLGPFVVDIENGRLQEFLDIEPGYQLQENSLHFSELEIESNTNFSRVFPSGQGRIAWLPNDYGPLPGAPLVRGTLHGPVSLHIHDEARGKRFLFSKKFQGLTPSHQYPEKNLCMWVREAKFRRTQAFDDLPIYELPKPQTHTDTRPKIADCIHVELGTDKKNYRRHEPVVLTITVRNLSDEVIRFETKRLLHGAQPFGLDIKGERYRSNIDVFDDNRNQPKAEYLEFLPGEETAIECEFEVAKAGEHEVRLRFEHYSRWAGNIKVAAKIMVSEETNSELLQAKFDRLMAYCVRRSKLGLNTFSASGFSDLGSEGVPLLIGYLRSCENDRLRAGLGRGLQTNMTIETLEYVQYQLSHKLNLSDATRAALDSDDYQIAQEARRIREMEARTVANCLFGLCGYRTHDKSELKTVSRKVLFSAANSEMPEVRKAIVEAFATVVHEDVDRLMLKLAGDASPEIAARAARYIAFRQQLSLREWFQWAKENPIDLAAIAGHSITDELAEEWKLKIATIPSSIASATPDAATRNDWNDVIDMWIEWCDQNSRVSNSFFDPDREKAAKIQRLFKYWGEGNGPPRIQL